jgi:hypothetical protein
LPENLSDIIDRLKRSLRDQQVKSSDIRGSTLNPISTFFEKTLLDELVKVDGSRSRLFEDARMVARDSRDEQIIGAFLLDLAKVGFSVCG